MTILKSKNRKSGFSLVPYPEYYTIFMVYPALKIKKKRKSSSVVY
jgi:hypothetical protein